MSKENVYRNNWLDRKYITVVCSILICIPLSVDLVGEETSDGFQNENNPLLFKRKKSENVTDLTDIHSCYVLSSLALRMRSTA